MEITKLEYFTRELPFNQTSSSDDNGDGLTFEGYAAVFNTWTRISSMWEGEFDEMIQPGAFDQSLRESTPVFQFDHGHHPLIGSIPLGNLTETKEDEKGLFVRGRLTDNWLIQPVRDAVANGSIKGMSFRFSVADGGETWVEVNGQTPKRTLTRLNVMELGPVVFPAYDTTTAGVRSVERVRSMLGLQHEGPGVRERGVSDADRVKADRAKRLRTNELRRLGVIR